MPRRVAIYSPDRHIRYDLRTLEEHGVGGGVTARVRLAHALASRGHPVTLFVNCMEETVLDNVVYRNGSQQREVETDIFIASTSGDQYSLETLRDIKIAARLRILLAHGVDPPLGFEACAFDFVYAPSNFVRECVLQSWGVPPHKLFVSPRGVMRDAANRESSSAPVRDPWRLVYASHPSKGLDAAIGVLRKLRVADERFNLHVYGGAELWGRDTQPPISEPGLTYHGLIGQRQLREELQKASFSINLQAREEPFGMIITESMQAGCIVIASPVGAFREIVRHASNGFLVAGDYTSSDTQQRAADQVVRLLAQPENAAAIRRAAEAYPCEWDTIAAAWDSHWRWALGVSAPGCSAMNKCPHCNARCAAFPDGYHCPACGHYERNRRCGV